MQFPKPLLLAFVLTSLLLIPSSSGVEAKLQPKPFRSSDGGKVKRDEKIIHSPKPQLECDPGQHGPDCQPTVAAAAEGGKWLSKRSPYQVSRDDGTIEDDPYSDYSARLRIIKDHTKQLIPTVIDPPAITITSSLSTSSDQPGFLGICVLPFSNGDGVYQRGHPSSATGRFLDVAKKTATCNYVTDRDVHCIEQGGKQDMKQEDYTWWEQAFCKRCVDAGGRNRDEFACPESMHLDGGKEKKPVKGTSEPSG